MLELTFDPDARTLYAYFTQIEAGDDASQRDVDGQFLLDADGQIVGMRVTTPHFNPDAFALTTLHDQAYHNGTVLQLQFTDVPVAQTVELPYQAIIDLSRKGQALGIEFIADPEFGLKGRLRHLQPFIIEVFGSDDDNGDSDSPQALEVRSDIGLADVDDEPELSSYGDAEAAEAPAAVAPLPPVTDQQQAPDVVAAVDEDDAPDHIALDETTPPPAPLLDAEQVRAGFVALVGKPNVGKSTLLNAYLGHKVSIVSPKPQTTRIQIRGIVNRPDAQVIFVDTPGLHNPKSKLGEYMVEAARRAIPDADVVCFVVDASQAPDAQDRSIAESIHKAHKPTILVLNKIDITHRADTLLPLYRALGPWEMEVALSALKSDGIQGLLEEIITRLPAGPRLFPADQETDLSEREQVAELIREKVLLNTQQEVPHGVAVEVDEWERRGERLYIRATVNVERDGHKKIIIGERGQMLKKIGAAARYEIERLLHEPVFLDLWIKVRKDWRSDASSLRWLGYDVRKLK